jgi:hypothetical protein
MKDEHSTERAAEDTARTKRAWSTPTLEVVPAEDTEGPVQPAFPQTDSITGIS